MREKISLSAVMALTFLALAGFFLMAKNTGAFTETRFGEIKANWGLDSGSGDLVKEFMASHSGKTMLRGAFQMALLQKVIEQAGENNYPKTAKLVSVCMEVLGPSFYNTSLVVQPSPQWYQNKGAELGLPGSPGSALGFILGAFSYNMATSYDDLFVGGTFKVLRDNTEGTPIPTELDKLKGFLEVNDPLVLAFLNSPAHGFDEVVLRSLAGISCDHTNKYNYTFQYIVSQNNSWVPISDTKTHKCENIKLIFTPVAGWLAAIVKREGSASYNYRFYYGSPPTQFIACADQAGCLSQAQEHVLTTETWGKGVQKVPADFVAQTEKSLVSSNALMKCADGVCVSYSSGSFPLTASAPASSYFGQCRGYGATVSTPEAAVPAVTSNYTANIVNRAPTPAVSFAKNSIIPNEEVNVTCDIVDPDECSDKIAKVKWTCADSNGNSGNCLLWKARTGVWNTDGVVQELVSGEKANPYRATAMFKASVAGNYAVTCEAWDDDPNNPLSRTGISGITVAQNCIADRICNPTCPADPDCNYGQIPAHSSSYCALLPSKNSTMTICGENGSVEYKAYVSGIEPQSYKWKCSEQSAVKTSIEPEITCDYDKTGTYLPSLSIVGADDKETACVTQTSAEVTNNSKCKIELRKAGSGDEYSASANIQSGDTVEAKVTRQCISGGKVNWSITDETSDLVKIKIDSSDDKTIEASVIQDGKPAVTCSKADLTVNEKIQWGN